MSADNEWLQNLKAGDTVVLTDGESEVVRQVNKVTRTQVVLAGERRMRRSDGRNMGGSVWDSCWIEPATTERVCTIRERKEHQRRIVQLRDAKWSTLPAELVKQVHAIVFSEEPPK